MELAFPHYGQKTKWKVIYGLSIFLLTIPILVLIFQVLGLSPGETLASVKNSLPLYLGNTIWILAGVSLGTLLIGVPTAWMVSTADFPGRRHLEWLLILPLTLPGFINAIAYSGLTDYAGPVRTFLRNSSFFGDRYLDIMTPWGVIFVMSVVLYPYVYLTSRAAFTMQSGSLIEVARTLGLSPTRTFFRIVIPVAWPLIFSGLSLVMMEVLNDFGTVSYYGVPTFTAGIFRSWLSLGNLPGAIFLSLILIAFVLVLLVADDHFRQRKGYAEQNAGLLISRKKIHGGKRWVILGLCSIPFLLGFAIPSFQLLIWLGEVWKTFSWRDFFATSLHSLQLAILAAVIIIFISLLFSFSQRIIRPVHSLKLLSKTSSLGYATPGAVIGVGIIICILWINDDWLYAGIVAMLYGYSIRFFAVGNNAIENSLNKVDLQMDEAAISLGSSRWKVLWKIILPLIRPGMIVAFIMVFVDVTKELPLTLILRPFNYETLATNAFQYAKDELVAQAAPASLLIIILGSISVYLLNKTLRVVR